MNGSLAACAAESAANCGGCWTLPSGARNKRNVGISCSGCGAPTGGFQHCAIWFLSASERSIVIAFIAPTPRVVRSAVRALRGAAAGDVNLLSNALNASLGFDSGLAIGVGASTTALGAGAGLGTSCGGLIGEGASSAVGSAGAGFGT